MVDVSDLQKTPMFEMHQKHGGKIVNFGGWALPVQYEGIIDEHRTVRQKAGLFDVSHMGEIRVTGSESEEAVNYLMTNDVKNLSINQVIYTPMCYPDGGTVDDLLVYKCDEQDFWLVVNAANKDKDFEWIKEQVEGFDVEVTDESDDTAQLALQGPKAEEILQQLTDVDLGDIKFFWFKDGVQLAGHESLVSRTGYTGEDGFEIYTSLEAGPIIWQAIMEAGEDAGVAPAGLGARDTLRFEAGLCLYGQELSADINPLEAGLNWFVSLDKEDFNGKEALVEAKEEGLEKRLIGFEMLDRGIPRTGYPIYNAGGEQVGEVSSGSYAPTLEKNLGLGFVSPDLTDVGTELRVGVRNRKLKAVVVKFPFYQKEG